LDLLLRCRYHPSAIMLFGVPNLLSCSWAEDLSKKLKAAGIEHQNTRNLFIYSFFSAIPGLNQGTARRSTHYYIHSNLRETRVSIMYVQYIRGW